MCVSWCRGFGFVTFAEEETAFRTLEHAGKHVVDGKEVSGCIFTFSMGTICETHLWVSSCLLVPGSPVD